MLQDILALGIVLAAFGWMLYSLVRMFVSKGKSNSPDCGCGNASSCDGKKSLLGKKRTT